MRYRLDTVAATKADFADLEVRLLKWGIGIALAVAGLLFAALRLTGGGAQALPHGPEIPVASSRRAETGRRPQI